MAQYRMNNPYDPRYALPANVLAEPPGRGAIVTAQLPRGTYYPAPRNWSAGYALPGYVKAENHGRGTIVTAQTRRKTIPTRIPESLGDSDERALERLLEEGAPLALTLPQEVYALDGTDAPTPGFRGDPIKAYGERASEFVLRTLRREVPAEFRGVALEALLDEVEPGLFARVTERANQYKERGMGAESAVKAAMASSMSEGIAKEIMKLGGGKAPAMRSQLGLGFYGEPAAAIALDGIWSSIKKGIKKVGSGIKTAAKKTGSGIAWPAKQAYKGVKKGASYVKKGAQKSWEWGQKAVDKLGSLACGVMNNPVAPMAAGAAASAYGAPPQVGAIGAQVGASLCKKSDTPAAPQAELMKPRTPAWVLPAAIGGAGLLAVLLVTRK